MPSKRPSKKMQAEKKEPLVEEVKEGKEVKEVKEEEPSQTAVVEEVKEVKEEEQPSQTAVVEEVKEVEVEKGNLAGRPPSPVSVSTVNPSNPKRKRNADETPKKKKKRDQPYGKRPLNGYMFYFRERAKDDGMKALKVTELARAIAVAWQELSQEEKQPYLKMASDAKSEYMARVEMIKQQQQQQDMLTA